MCVPVGKGGADDSWLTPALLLAPPPVLNRVSLVRPGGDASGPASAVGSDPIVAPDTPTGFLQPLRCRVVATPLAAVSVALLLLLLLQRDDRVPHKVC